jgi:ABC-type phosphate transport system ATPase subunit
VVVLGQSKASTNPLKSLWNSLSSPQKKELAKIMGNSSLTKGEMMKRLNKMVDRIKNKKAKVKRRFYKI